MITNIEKWHYIALKSVCTDNGFNRPIRRLSRLFRGITANHHGDFYCLNCSLVAAVSKPCKPFVNGSSDNTKLRKTQLHQIGKPGGFLEKLLRPLLKNGLNLMKNVLKTPAERDLILLGLTAAASETDVAIHKKCLGWARRY